MKFKKLTDVRYLVIHCSATPPKMDVTALDVDRWHRERGFARIGYHAFIRRDGTIEAGRELDTPGAHALRFNEISLGVCMAGGVHSLPAANAENNFTPAQFTSLRVVLRAWKAMYPNAEILGHRDLPSPHSRLRECPSFDVRRWLELKPLFGVCS